MNDLPVFDKKSALAALGNDEEIYGIVLETYLETTPDLLEQVKSALGEGNLVIVQRHAHSLKSSSSTVGAMALGARAGALEEGCRHENLVTVAGLLELVLSGYNELKKYIDGSINS